MADPPNLLDAVVELSFTVQAIMAKVGARHDVSLTQMRLLGILRDREPRMLDLADHLGLDKSSVTGLIDRAEARGLVRRRRLGGDGRSITVVMTAQGRELAARGQRELKAELDALTAPLDADAKAALARLLSRLLAP